MAAVDHRRRTIDRVLVELVVGRDLDRLGEMTVRRGDHPLLRYDGVAFDARSLHSSDTHRTNHGALDNDDTQAMDAVDHRETVLAARIGVVDEHRGDDEAQP